MLIPLKVGAGLGAGLDAGEPALPHPVAASRTATTRTQTSSTGCQPVGRGLLFWARIHGCLLRAGSLVNDTWRSGMPRPGTSRDFLRQSDAMYQLRISRIRAEKDPCTDVPSGTPGRNHVSHMPSLGKRRLRPCLQEQQSGKISLSGPALRRGHRGIAKEFGAGSEPGLQPTALGRVLRSQRNVPAGSPGRRTHTDTFWW